MKKAHNPLSTAYNRAIDERDDCVEDLIELDEKYQKLIMKYSDIHGAYHRVMSDLDSYQGKIWHKLENVRCEFCEVDNA